MLFFRTQTLARLTATAVLLASFCGAQTIEGSGASDAGATLNQEQLSMIRGARQISAASATNARPHVIVFTGDRVISQFVDGSAWQTSITVVNLETHSTSFDVLFFLDNGNDFNVPIIGLSGLNRSVHVTLNPFGTLSFQTTGTSSVLTPGWALLSQANNDSVGITGVFRLNLPGQQSQEAVVPAVNQFEQHFLLPFDDTVYIMGLAIANPTTNSVSVVATIRNEDGQTVDVRQLSLAPYNHAAFVLPSTWSSTRGMRGTIEFVTSGYGVGALGLRFDGIAFTSVSVLENFNWIVQ
jgi:hypothetical protein